MNKIFLKAHDISSGMKNANYILIILLITCIWAYIPGLSGGFILDDRWNIYQNKWIHIDELTINGLWNAMMSGESGPLKRPLAMLSFALNHWLTGLDPYWMKVTNLVIHLFNSVLLCLVLIEIFRRLSVRFDSRYPESLAYIITAAWAVHPINVTTVSYIVQRMTSLASLFMLSAILIYLYLRKNNLATVKGYFYSVIIIILWLSGLLTKEIVILSGAYVLLIEWRLYGFRTSSEGQTRHLYLTLGVLNVPILLGILYVLVNYQYYFIDSYHERSFNLFERVLTEPRVLMEYIRLIIIPDVTGMDIYSDDIRISKSFIQPLTTLYSFVMLGLIFLLACKWWNRFPLFCFGIFWFFISHLLESTVLSLELSFLHRNYLGSVGILFVIAEGLLAIYRTNKHLALVICALFFIVFTGCTRLISWQWSDDINYLLSSAERNPDSARANLWVGHIFLLNALRMEHGKEQNLFLMEAEKYNSRVKVLKPDDISVEMSSLRAYLYLKKEPPRELVDAIISNIQSSDIRYMEISSIDVLSKCIFEDDCLLSNIEYKNILYEILKNKNLSDEYRSFLLNRYALYFHRIENDVQKAIEIQNQAIAIAPALLDNYIKLVAYYMEIGDISGMERTIAELTKHDRYNMYSKYIKLYQLEVEKAKILPEEHKNIQK